MIIMIGNDTDTEGTLLSVLSRVFCWLLEDTTLHRRAGQMVNPPVNDPIFVTPITGGQGGQQDSIYLIQK